MSATIFLEGGARDSKTLRISCQRAFRKLLEKIGSLATPRPRLIACGGRDEVYAKFCLEHGEGAVDYIAMWIDSEEPVDDLNQPWEYLQSLRSVAAWPRPAGAGSDQVLFMTTSMETWIAADRDALRAYFGQGLNENQLPPLQNLEDRPRADVFNSLRQATQRCKTRYDKGEVSFEVFEELNPAALEKLPSFVRNRDILTEQL